MSDDDQDLPRMSRPGTLPPAAKTSREIMHGIKDIALPLMALLAVKWGIADGYVFAMALAHVLGGNMALRKQENGHGG